MNTENDVDEFAEDELFSRAELDRASFVERTGAEENDNENGDEPYDDEPAEPTASVEKPEKVILIVSTEWPGINGQKVDKLELDPDQWERLTPDEREGWFAGIAAEVFAEYCSYGYKVVTS